MKGMMLVALLFLAGCAGITPLEQLQSDALITGDWSKVEKRERAIAMRNMHSFVQQCPSGSSSYCETGLGSKRCACVKNDRMRSIFSQR